MLPLPQWTIVPADTETQMTNHVVPIDDIREHEMHEGCWCDPVEEDDVDPSVLGTVILHNAADDREKYESGRRKPN